MVHEGFQHFPAIVWLLPLSSLWRHEVSRLRQFHTSSCSPDHANNILVLLFGKEGKVGLLPLSFGKFPTSTIKLLTSGFCCWHLAIPCGGWRRRNFWLLLFSEVESQRFGHKKRHHFYDCFDRYSLHSSFYAPLPRHKIVNNINSSFRTSMFSSSSFVFHFLSLFYRLDFVRFHQ